MIITNRKTHLVQQGSPEWLALRTGYPAASEAPTAQSVGSYQTRSDLIRQKATGITPEHDAHTLRRFAEGHKAEAAARPLAEAFIDEDLSPVTMTVEADGFALLASLDGLNFDGDISWECKLWNEDLAEQARTNSLAPNYTVQMDQQQLVSGAKRTLFTCSDGTPERTVHCWYESSEEKKAALLVHWRQFEKDVAAYAPGAEPVAQPTVKIRDALPALRIEAFGEVAASNLDEFKAVVLGRINGVNTELKTDQEFADADADGKWLRDVADKMRQAIQMVRSNIQPVDAVLVVLEQLEGIATKKAIFIEKLVKSEKDVRKELITATAQNELAAHIAAVNEQMGASYLPPPVHGFFGPVIKGLKSLESMQDKVRAALAQAIGDANATALRLRTNRDQLKQDGTDWITLFPDFAAVGTKSAEDFQAVAAFRIAKHKEAEAKRLDAERERIRAEEQAKADAAMRAELIKKEQEAQAGIAEARKADALPAPLLDALSDTASFVSAEAVSAIDAKKVIQSAKRSATDDGARIALGQIKELIAPLSIDAAGLVQLGFPHVATDKSSKLYRSCDFEAIRAAMIRHLQSVEITHPLAA